MISNSACIFLVSVIIIFAIIYIIVSFKEAREDKDLKDDDEKSKDKK